MQNINEIEDLIKLISKLPGLGPKSAKRIVLKLINNRDELDQTNGKCSCGCLQKCKSVWVMWFFKIKIIWMS